MAALVHRRHRHSHPRGEEERGPCNAYSSTALESRSAIPDGATLLGFVRRRGELAASTGGALRVGLGPMRRRRGRASAGFEPDVGNGVTRSVAATELSTFDGRRVVRRGAVAEFDSTGVLAALRTRFAP